ncbi:MAG: hypothetical protein JW712_04945 [Dehalococcoidales bacterium]|nr:hypothetical protein [Dehalococcoidales bacterium]
MNTKHRMLLSTCITAILGIGLITGCTPPELPYMKPVSEFSFTGIWDEMLTTTGASRTDIHLQSFSVDTRADKIVTCSTTFSSRDEEGKLIGYTIGSDMEGKLQWSSGEMNGELPERTDYDPTDTFAELDGIGIETIINNTKSARIRIDYIYDERLIDYADTYRLDNGELLPLREVSFPKDSCAATIQIIRSYPRDVEIPFSLGRLHSMGEWWVTGRDLDKAESVIFAKFQQGPEFVSFMEGIYSALPEGWKMGLNTHEGYMSSPAGLDEPLFVLNFEDTQNYFTIPGDPTASKISPNLRLYFYSIEDKISIIEIIEQQEQYSWDIPQYYDEGVLYLAITSPVYINSGQYSDEAMIYYKQLEQALTDFFAARRAGPGTISEDME